LDFAQLLIGGIANGCVYGLVALGFVLIYKATEAVNFAQGDMMMFGAFVTLAFVNEEWLGLPFLVGVALAITVMVSDMELLSSTTLKGIITNFSVAITLIMVAVPEGLPLATSISVSFSLNSMRKQNLLVKNLESPVTMGGV